MNIGGIRARLVPASLEPPVGLWELLADLGDGENGFGGTPVPGGCVTLDSYLQTVQEQCDPSKIAPRRVPQTTYWLMDASSAAVGMVRLRHSLNDQLRFKGGHIGLYVRKDQRGKGYGKAALALALDELRKFGEEYALITTDTSNAASIAAILANGGRLVGSAVDPNSGVEFERYRVELC